MANQHLTKRLTGLQSILNGVHAASAGMSASTKGGEREAIIDDFLGKVLPPIYRFGTGDATDKAGNRSGQLDVVIEYPFAPTIPTVGSGQTRLYLAEGVAAVVEVKSDLAAQWSEAERTAGLLSPVKRKFGFVSFTGAPPSEDIPLIAIGYTGWKNLATLQQHVEDTPGIFGALVIDSGLYVSRYARATGPAAALWAMICDLSFLTNMLSSATMEPADYIK